MILRRIALLAACLAFASTAPTLAAAPSTPALNAEEQDLVGRAATYLQGLNTAEGRFVQTDARGGVTQGAFYLKRPGRIRFEYDPPAAKLVVADGRNVNVYDQRLKSFNRLPLGFTPLHVFLAKDVRLDRGVFIERVARAGDGFEITARDPHRRKDGAITLVFAGSPLRLTEWTITDSQGGRTRVQLVSLKPAPSLDDKLFVWTGLPAHKG